MADARPHAGGRPSSRSEPIFVFGSNLAGRHGKGAAQFAARFHDAEQGIAEGLTGSAYALPTKDKRLLPLPLPDIHRNIATFLTAAASMPDTRFKVTRVACGLTGCSDADIAPSFASTTANCLLPFLWRRRLGRTDAARVIVAGTRAFANFQLLEAKLDHLLSSMTSPVEIISGTAAGADRLGEDYARQRGLRAHRVPADWDRYGKAAGMIRNQHMAWGASHLVAFWDGHSLGTRNMIETARADGLAVRVVHVG